MNAFQLNAERRRRRRGSTERKAYAAVRDYCYDRLGEEQAETILASSKPYRENHPVVGLPAHAVNGEFHPAFVGGAGFTSYNDIINALTTNARGQRLNYRKNSITTVAAQMSSMWGAGGLPAAGTFGTALTGRTRDRTAVGAANYTDATGGRIMYLLRAGVGSTVGLGTMILYDRLAEYPFNGTVTGASTFTTQPTLPARDAAGGTAGTGVLLFVENDIAGATTTATGPTDNFTYTNSAAVGSHTTGALQYFGGAIVGQLLNAGGAGQGPWWPLQSGDFGVASIQSHSISATITSTQVTAVLARPLATVPMLAAASYSERDLVLQLASMPAIYAGTAFAWLIVANGATSPFFAELLIAEN